RTGWRTRTTQADKVRWYADDIPTPYLKLETAIGVAVNSRTATAINCLTTDRRAFARFLLLSHRRLHPPEHNTWRKIDRDTCPILAQKGIRGLGMDYSDTRPYFVLLFAPVLRLRSQKQNTPQPVDC